MVRNRKGTSRRKFSDDEISRATEAVTNKEQSLRDAAERIGMTKLTRHQLS